MFELPDIMPFAVTCGIQRVAAAPEAVVLRLPFATAVLDQRGTVHLGAVFTLAHVALSELLALNLDLRDVSFVTSDVRLRRHRGARSDLECRVSLAASDRKRLAGALATEGRAQLVTTVVVREADGAAAAEMDFHVEFRAVRPGPRS